MKDIQCRENVVEGRGDQTKTKIDKEVARVATKRFSRFHSKYMKCLNKLDDNMPRWQARWHVESRAPTIWIRPRRQPRRV